MASKNQNSCKSFTFTWNNYEPATIGHLKKLCAESGMISVMYVAQEVAPTTGTPHLQGYVTFKQNKRFPAVIKFLSTPTDKKVVVFKAEGSKTANYSYIIQGLKDGDVKNDTVPVIEYDCTQQGARNDLKKVIELARTHGLHAVAEHYPEQYVRYHKGIGAYLNEMAPLRVDYPRVYWLFGPTGIGKTEFAFKRTHIRDVYIANLAPNWYDGLANHNWVIFDEFDKQPFPLRELLMILDKYPCRVPVKTSSANWAPPNIVITSSVAPEMLYNGTEYDQVWRRVSYIGTRPTYADPWDWIKAPEDHDHEMDEDYPE